MSRSAFQKATYKASAAFFDPHLPAGGARPYGSAPRGPLPDGPDFGPVGGNGHGPDTPPPSDPSDWSVDVPGKGRARPSVPVNFIGTIHHEKEDPFASDDSKQKRAAELEAIALKNKKIIEDAVFILSQSPTGRDVLAQMTAEGYQIVFDDRRTGDRGAGGLCDPSDKMLILKSHDSAEYLALLIGHEAVHAVQNTRHDLFPSTRHRPEVGIKMSFAIEADAYAQQTQIALELSYGDPAGPKDQMRMRGPLEQMRERFPDIVKAAEKVLHSDDALTNGASVAAAFEAFYDNFHLRTFYEDAHLEWANMYAPKLKGSFPWVQRHFSKDVDSDYIKDRIQHRGLPYLNIHAPNLTFNDTRHSGVSEKSAATIDKFYKDHLQKLKKPVLKTFGVHMKDAARWVMGLGNNNTTAVLKRDPAQRKGPRKKGNFKE